jgi:hypothetical protein
MILESLFLAGAAAAIAGIVMALALVGVVRRAAAPNSLFRLFETVATICVWTGGFIALYTAPLVLLGLLIDAA